MVAGAVQGITDQVAEHAKTNAPPTKTWVARGDDVVRREHRRAHGQEVPDNLRFVLDSPAYDQHHYGAGPRQQLRVPRDPEAMPGLTVNCRCMVVRDPLGVARHIDAGRVRVAGPVVTGHVVCTGNRVVEAEFGNGEEHGTRFMGRALGETVRRMRA
jgi:hypothetical protein